MKPALISYWSFSLKFLICQVPTDIHFLPRDVTQVLSLVACKHHTHSTAVSCNTKPWDEADSNLGMSKGWSHSCCY